MWCKVGCKKDVLTVEESTFMLEIETEKIWECDNFLSLFITYIAAVYAFNLVYPKKWKKYAIFQKVVMCLVDGDACLDRKLFDCNGWIKNQKKVNLWDIQTII